MHRKQLIFTILFCIYLKIFYFNIAGSVIDNFYNVCTKNDIMISQLQTSIFSAIAIICYFFSIAVMVALFVYWFRHFKLGVYLLLGFLMRYARELFILSPLLMKRETSFLGLLSEPENIVTLLVDLSVTFLGSYLGYRYARRISYLDKRDKTDFTFWGFSKRFWCLIIIAFNPILVFLCRYSIISIYETTKGKDLVDSLANIFNIQYSGGLFRILTLPLMVCMFWALAIYAFYVALKAIKDERSRYRKVKIVGILIVLPVTMIIGKAVALIRQWF
ncbi:hypothetical protein ACFL0P_01715 [Candidatus Omnitrophota bacterium]